MNFKKNDSSIMKGVNMRKVYEPVNLAIVGFRMSHYLHGIMKIVAECRQQTMAEFITDCVVEKIRRMPEFKGYIDGHTFKEVENN